MKIKTLLYAWCCILLFSCESDVLKTDSSPAREGSITFAVKQTENLIPSSKSVQEIKADSLTLKLEVSDFSGVAKTSSSLTRASRLTKENLEDFGVLGYHTVNGGFDKIESIPNFMYNTKVGKVESQWTYAPVKYFPMNEKDSVSFFAYAPYNAEHSCLTLSENTKKGVPSLTYTMPEEVTDQVDLLVANAAMNQTREQDKVAFSFSHALSCISFSIKGNGEKVKSIGLTSIATSGTLKLDASEEITWSNLSQPSSKVYNAGIAYDKDASYVVSTAEGTSSADLMTADGYLMVIPQQLTADTKVIVTYENGWKQFISLSDILEELVVGKSYHFSITTEEPPYSANCFIVDPAVGKITIPTKNVNYFWGKGGDGAIATHMGAVTRSPNAEDLAFVVPENMITNTNYTVELVWSGVDIDLKVVNKTATNFTVSGCNKAGNAVVCVKNPSGVILWSWHLWMTDFDPMEGATTLPSGLVAMDRNLGATSAVSGEVGTLGLMYQWGRKDPFLGSNSIVEGSAGLNEHFRRKPIIGEIKKGEGYGTLLKCVYNPNYGYVAEQNEFNECVRSGHLSLQYGSNRWGGAKSNNDPTAYKNTKSLYDPCPEGWRVPWTKNWIETEDKLQISDAVNGLMVQGVYFPCTGYLILDDWFLVSVGSIIQLSTSQAGSLPNESWVFYLNKNIHNGIYRKKIISFRRAYANPVRPVRDI